jgi:hypothetical protein
MPDTTRVEIVAATQTAFDRPPATVIDMLEAAILAGATQTTLDVIKELPHRRYATPRELWPHLPDIAVEATNDRIDRHAAEADPTEALKGERRAI